VLTKLRKATGSFVKSVGMQQLSSYWTFFLITQHNAHHEIQP